MDGDFTDYKPGYYTVEFSQADDFRNKDKSAEDLAKYGMAYAVKFKGDAGTFYWSSRTQPQEDQRVYGHVEPSKSGKSMNFRRDEEPGKDKPSPTNTTQQPTPWSTSSLSPSPSKPKTDAYLKDMSNTPIMMYNGSLHYAKDLGLNLISNPEDYRAYVEYVKVVTEEMLTMIDNIRNGEASTPAPMSLGDRFREQRTSGEHDYGEPNG